MYGAVKIEKTSTYTVGMEAWSVLDESTQKKLKESAKSILQNFSELEPNLIDSKKEDTLIINIQSDIEGISGDVRDLVLSRKSSSWEIRNKFKT